MIQGVLKLVTRPVPSWAPIGLENDAPIVDVLLRHLGSSVDVAGNHVVASLVPLTLAIGIPGVAAAELAFIDRLTTRVIGTLSLRRARVDGGDLGISLLEVRGSDHACLPPVLRTWQRLLQAKWHHDGGFHMSNASIQHLMLFYLLPRPVVLVSVDDGANDNLFPMDLIGSLRDRFTLALRNSSPSIRTMRNCRRVALANLPLRLVRTVYGLGKHHRLARIDWSRLPFEAVRTEGFGLRVPAEALRVRECEIETWREVGSHTLHICRVVSDRTLRTEPMLHHTCGLHRVYRERLSAIPWREPVA